MNSLVFGGISTHNSEWVQELILELEKLGPNTKYKAHSYLSWKAELDGDDKQQIRQEIDHTRDSYKTDEFEIIIGKSFGCLVALHSGLKPKYLILIGPPNEYLKQFGYDLDKNIETSKSNLLVMVNGDDHLSDVSSLRTTTDNLKNSAFKQLDGKKHKYLDIKSYAKDIDDFVN